jgi:hypothetical protein
MKFLKYFRMTMLLVSAFAFASVAAYAQEEVSELEACAEASVSALPLAAAALLGIPSALIFARRRRTLKK